MVDPSLIANPWIQSLVGDPILLVIMLIARKCGKIEFRLLSEPTDL